MAGIADIAGIAGIADIVANMIGLTCWLAQLEAIAPLSRCPTLSSTPHCRDAQSHHAAVA